MLPAPCWLIPAPPSGWCLPHQLSIPCPLSQGNLAALYDSMPKAAVLVQLGPDGGPDLGSARRVLASEVAVGQLMLVKPGEQVNEG